MGKTPLPSITQSELEAAFARVQEAVLALQAEIDELHSSIDDPPEEIAGE